MSWNSSILNLLYHLTLTGYMLERVHEVEKSILTPPKVSPQWGGLKKTCRGCLV